MHGSFLLKDRGFFHMQLPLRLFSKLSEILPLRKSRFRNNFLMRYGDSCRRFLIAN